MTIWVDAAACPAAVMDRLNRTAARACVPLALLADARSIEQVAAGDLVVTADIPLAAAAIRKGAVALDPAGGGGRTGGQTPFAQQDSRSFVAQLELWLAQHGGQAGHDTAQQ
jgi:uncharacterized protein YaiI (UPF0178 family)